MSDLFLDLVPFAIGLAITPAAIAAVILLLASPLPVPNAVSFTAAFALVYGAISAVVLAFSVAATGPLVGESVKSAITFSVGVLFLLLAVVEAARSHRRVTGKVAGPLVRPGGAAPTGSWMTRIIDRATPRTSFLLGAALATLNPNVPILLAGLLTVASRDPGLGESLAGIAMLIGSSLAGLVIPIAWYMLHRASAARGLKRVARWIGTHQHWLDLGVLIVFGVVFVLSGLSGL